MDKLYYVWREDFRYETYTTEQPLDNYTTIKPPQFDPPNTFPYWTGDGWELR